MSRCPEADQSPQNREVPMHCTRSVLLILFLVAGLLPPPVLGAQEGPGPPPSVEEARGFVLEQNYPNPVNPETWIPFHLEESLFMEDEPVPATIRIYNSLNQLVAYPEALDHPAGRRPVLNLPYAEPGSQLAYWDGRDLAGRPVATGVYYMQMVVGDARPQTRKLTVHNPRRTRSIIPWFGPGDRP
jgi:hypothetical protein